MNKTICKLLVAALVAGITGCASSAKVEPVVVVQSAQPPGVVQEIWEEPMVDVIDVPPGLDPEGHYYRPGHQEVVEIRQGRWKYHRSDADNK